MNVFEMRERLIGNYESFIRSFVEIADPRLKAEAEKSLASGLLWPSPLIQLNPAFEPGGMIDDLVAAGVLHRTCSEVFRAGKIKDDPFPGHPMRLHLHQDQAVRTARTGANYVLTTGTGSGKSLSYILPIVDHVLRNGSGRGVQAIVVYPMNALAISSARNCVRSRSSVRPCSGPRRLATRRTRLSWASSPVTFSRIRRSPRRPGASPGGAVPAGLWPTDSA
jgi:ATP-dependent helicase YprA (DUF1998 family)